MTLTGKNNRKPGGPVFTSIKRETLISEGASLTVEDRINNYFPFTSERYLLIDGTSAYYSVVPLCPAWHRLLCFTFCEDAAKTRDPSFYHHALVLGLGGGAVPRWLLEEYPDLQVDVVDHSRDIITLCKKYFVTRWADSERLRIYCMDAGEFKAPSYKYQFIFCDLFDGTNLAPVVSDPAFAENLREMTDEDGMLLINTGWGHLRDIKHTYRGLFDELHQVKRDPGQTEVVQCVVRGKNHE